MISSGSCFVMMCRKCADWQVTPLVSQQFTQIRKPSLQTVSASHKLTINQQSTIRSSLFFQHFKSILCLKSDNWVELSSDALPSTIAEELPFWESLEMQFSRVEFFKMFAMFAWWLTVQKMCGLVCDPFFESTMHFDEKIFTQNSQCQASTSTLLFLTRQAQPRSSYHEKPEWYLVKPLFSSSGFYKKATLHTLQAGEINLDWTGWVQ